MPKLDQEALRQSIEKVTGATEAVFQNAVHMVRQSGLGAEDLPRICISAGCRGVELMIERYHRVLTGQEQMTRQDRATLRHTIITSAADLELALKQAQETVNAIARMAADTTAPTADDKPNADNDVPPEKTH